VVTSLIMQGSCRLLPECSANRIDTFMRESEDGTNQNVNGLIQEYLPKGKEFPVS
jgi:hypothetical protein